MFISRHVCGHLGFSMQALDGPKSLSENGYFSQSLRQAQILILEIYQYIPAVKIFAFLDLGKNISFSDGLLRVCPRIVFVAIANQKILIHSKFAK